ALVNDRPVPLDDVEMRGLRRALGRVVTTRSSSAGCDVADHFTFTLTYRGRRATRCTLPCDWRAAVERLEALTGRPVVLPERPEPLAGRWAAGRRPGAPVRPRHGVFIAWGEGPCGPFLAPDSARAVAGGGGTMIVVWPMNRRTLSSST